MPAFWPDHTSPPSKSINIAESVTRAVLSTDVSRAAPLSIPELMGLAHKDVELLDAVIERAGVTATTFLTVFKAYNDILRERGLDPHEVVYYGKLLKLGTLKGKNWGEKWNIVKLQYGYHRSHRSAGGRDHQEAQTPCNELASTEGRVISLAQTDQDDDSFTMHSHQDDLEIGQTEGHPNSVIDTPLYHLTPRAFSPNRPVVRYAGNDIRKTPSHPLLSLPARLRSMSPARRRDVNAWDSEGSETTQGGAVIPSATPPSYRAALRSPPLHNPQPVCSSFAPYSDSSERPVSSPGMILSVATSKDSNWVKKKRSIPVTEDDAWNKIKVLRDEKDADRFRDDRLLEGCWEVWKQGFRWIITTNEQIGQARSNLLVRLSLQRWRALTASRREIFQKISTLANRRCLRVAFISWKTKLKGKKQTEWRHSMRMKMKHVREKRESKLRKDAWAKWRQSHRSHLSGQHYIDRVVSRCYRLWKERLFGVDYLHSVADEFARGIEKKAAERLWNHWRRATEMGDAERIVLERISLRVMGDVMDTWKQNAQDNHAADVCYDFALMKRIIRAWKGSQDRIRAMENRAFKHISRQDSLLLRAVFRVWKARERGRLLERVKAVRLVKDTWTAWQQNAQHKKYLNDLAVGFSLRTNSYLASSVFRVWHQVRATHHNALSFAVQYNSAQLRFKMLRIWRIRLRERFKMVKRARMVEAFFIARRSWEIWTHQLHERRRQNVLQELNTTKLRKSFQVWLQRSQRKKQCRLAEQRTRHRTTKAALTRWTNRVIEVKLRELETAQDRDAVILTHAFHKWRCVCIRHYEELSLMESYQLVKREENIRRMFHRWLASARVTRHRRVILKQKEDEMNLGTIAVAWDKWRDRFKDEKLRSVEYNVIIQCRRNVLFRAFGIWHSKTASLPAIRFHSSHTRAKYWRIWRAIMPRALQARVAREMHGKKALSKFLDKWVQAQRTKMALKAVARARYLRLPTAVPRQAITASRPAPTLLPYTAHSNFPRRTVHTDSTNNSRAEAGPSQPRPPPRPPETKTNVRNIPTLKTRSETSLSKFAPPRTREPSPTCSFEERSSTKVFSRPSSSVGGGEVGRSSLWLELRQVRRKSRPSSEHSRSSEPP